MDGGRESSQPKLGRGGSPHGGNCDRLKGDDGWSTDSLSHGAIAAVPAQFLVHVGSASPIRLVFCMLVTKLNLFLFSRIAMVTNPTFPYDKHSKHVSGNPHSPVRHIVSHDYDQGQWYVWA